MASLAAVPISSGSATKKTHEPTTVIAERQLTFTPHGTRSRRKIMARFHAPLRADEGHWSVLVEIVGPGKRSSSREISGFDAVQALVYAMAMVPLDIETLARELGGKVTFLGSEDLRFTYELPR